MTFPGRNHGESLTQAEVMAQLVHSGELPASTGLAPWPVQRGAGATLSSL